MKDLELTIYPKDPTYEPSDAFTVYMLGDGKKECAGTSCALPAKKRLTDAELSAEYWRAGWIAESEQSQQADDVARTLYRFAARPHYDEEPKP